MHKPREQEPELTFDEIAEQFVEALRNGQHPSIADYKTKYPGLSAEIDDLFPMLCELEIHQDASSGLNQFDASGIPEKTGRISNRSRNRTRRHGCCL